MWVCTYFLWFVVYSVFGWVYESTYCTINERKWENRGFLYGPMCPIYGTGIVAMMLLWQHLLAQGTTLEWWQVFLIAFFGSMVLEYSTHWALEKLFHAYWWDYSNMPLNVNGRICLPASTLFGLGGLLVVYVLYEPTVRITAGLSGALIEVLAMACMGLVSADTAITVSALTRFARAASAINRSVNEHMDQFVAEAVQRGEAAAQDLQERREEAVRTVAETVEGIRETGVQAADTLAQERDRFAASMRDSLLGNMDHLAREAGRRVRGLPAPEHMPALPGAEQLSGLWSDVRGKHWPHE